MIKDDFNQIEEKWIRRLKKAKSIHQQHRILVSFFRDRRRWKIGGMFYCAYGRRMVEAAYKRLL
jgi:hypothetical protein